MHSFALFTTDKLAAIVQFAIVLGIMVIVHELGHFLAAKACGVRVEAFAIGFGKRLFGFVHGGTDYRVNLLPIGGYVKMSGMELTSETPLTDDPGEFQNHPRWQRVIIAVAGPVFNFILAFFLLLGLYMTHHEIPAYINAVPVADYVSPNSPIARTGMQIGDRVAFYDNQQDPTWADLQQRSMAGNLNHETAFAYVHNGKRVDTKLFVESKGKQDDFDFEKLGMVPVEQTTPLQVASLQDSTTPAARAGLQPRDQIVAVDDFHPHSVEALLAYLQDGAGKPLNLTVERKDATGNPATLHLTATPQLMDTQEGKGYRLGFVNTSAPITVSRMSFSQASAASYKDNLKNSRLILDVLHRLFTRQVSVKSLSSPLGMGVQVHEAFKLGTYPLVMTMAMISLNLGIFNLLPIPILDGGMILFLFIESLMRRDVSIQIKERVFQVAFVCIVLFAAVVIFNDITKMLPTHIKP